MTNKTGSARWDALALKLHEARVRGDLLDLPARDELPKNIADSYYVQDRTIALSGKEPRAWKLGATIRAAQLSLGLAEPFTGPVLEGKVFPSPAEVDTHGFACHVFEPEVAITLGRDISGSIDAEQARAAIASYHPAIEIINFRFREGRSLDAQGMITDFGANGALVLGQAAPKGTDDYWTLTLDVRVNGETIASRTPPPPETDIGELLGWFSRHAAMRGYALRKGDIITTGSQAGVLSYRPGDLVEADFGDAGTARVQFYSTAP
jgi:2-keto-4-pentenoate hydratase